MKPELEMYINEKERMLTKQFMVNLNSEDVRIFKKCTTISSVDVAARKILLKHWEAEDYAS